MIDGRSCEHDCEDLERIDHPVNEVDADTPWSSQGYRVMRCRTCGDYWGVRYQWDAGTGHDDRCHRFGPDIATVRRHY